MSSIPEQFEERMTTLLGTDYPNFVGVLDSPAPVSIRLNSLKQVELKTSGVVPWAERGFYLASRPVFTLDPRFHAGAYYVQEASSMFLEQALLQHAPLDRPATFLDLCAAPGGKSTHIQNLIHNDSLLVSNEVIRSRVGALVENLQKWGGANCVVTSNDAEDFQQIPGLFDVIVVDAPCSGEGMFRKDPGARTEWSPENVAICAARQKRIIESVWPALKENGLLIYSTCTFNRAENEENLLWLAQNHDVEFLAIRTDPEWGIQEVSEDSIRGYRFYPHKVAGEGFFLAVVRKREHEDIPHFRNSPKDAFSAPSKKVIQEVETWLLPGDYSFIQREDIIQSLPARWQHVIWGLTRKLRVTYAGTYLATQKNNKLVPEHPLALSSVLNHSHFQTLELTEAEALSYLRKESLNLDTDYRGFAIMAFEGLPLGWGNVLPGRINNLYPSGWRIRM